MIRNLDFVNEILRTAFDHFTDRNFMIDEKVNPLDGHLFFLRGNKWKYLRNKLNPIFTSSKLKGMHDEIDKCGDNFVECIDKIADGRDFDLKELLARYTTDVIGMESFQLA